jgi:hypothetical protein
MKILLFFYIVIWVYATYYACYMLYRLLGDDAIPLYVSFELLLLIKWIINYKKMIL